jgi:bifunctional UDP-N-acetylglucosamine pyrophosphorylase/glucosamine-1-phosphate N-acetyltransferase
MRAGATIVDPHTTLIDAGVILEPDVEIGPGTQLAGTTVVEAGAHVGPGCTLRDSAIGKGAALTHVVGVSARVGPGVTVAPFTYLAPGTELPARQPGRRPRSGAGRAARKEAQA